MPFFIHFFLLNQQILALAIIAEHLYLVWSNNHSDLMPIHEIPSITSLYQQSSMHTIVIAQIDKALANWKLNTELRGSSWKKAEYRCDKAFQIYKLYFGFSFLQPIERSS